MLSKLLAFALLAGVAAAPLTYGEPPAMNPQTTTMPKVGDAAPAFDLPASDGTRATLADYAGKPLVLYFYPRADTPGCTKQACGLRDAQADLRAAGAEVVGVSPDGVEAVKAFHEKYGLNFTLLADAEKKACQAYGVWGERTRPDGTKSVGLSRTTFVIAPDGKVAKVFENVNVDGHDALVLDAVRSLGR